MCDYDNDDYHKQKSKKNLVFVKKYNSTNSKIKKHEKYELNKKIDNSIKSKRSSKKQNKFYDKHHLIEIKKEKQLEETIEQL